MTASRENQLDAWLALTGQTATAPASVTLPMLTGSMAPAIPVGARLEILVRPDRKCRAGDVVVFQEGDKLIAHRILLVLPLGRRRCLLEKGDANPLGRWRRETAVRGRVVGFTTAAGSTTTDPADSNLARRGLRRHLRQWLVTLGGLRAAASQGQENV